MKATAKLDHPNLKVLLEGNDFVVLAKKRRYDSKDSEKNSSSKDIKKQTPKSKQLGKFLQKYGLKAANMPKVTRMPKKRSGSKWSELSKGKTDK